MNFSNSLHREQIFRYVMVLLPGLTTTLIKIPEEFSVLHGYRATLAHKVNHSFKNANAEFNSAYHMRFGFIRGLEATRDIK